MADANGLKIARKRRMTGSSRTLHGSGLRATISRGSASSSTTAASAPALTATSTAHVWPVPRVIRKMPSAVASTTARLRTTASAPSVEARS